VLLIAFVAAMAFAPAAPEKNKGCTPAQTRALVVRFVSAFNRGDARTLNQVWDSKDWFKWYSVSSEPGKRVNAEASRRGTLLPYFAARHARHERLVLTSLQIKSYSLGYRDFLYRLTRSADDLPGGPVAYEGKGASSCVTGRLDVWSMGSGS
jgi:hypothetical protein